MMLSSNSFGFSTGLMVIPLIESSISAKDTESRGSWPKAERENKIENKNNIRFIDAAKIMFFVDNCKFTSFFVNCSRVIAT